MPALYIGHGAPPLLDDPLWSGQLRDLAAGLPRPKAILIVSAHWESAPLTLSASGPGVGLVYDFGGFDEKLLPDDLPDPGRDALAARIAAMMPDTEPVHQHPSRGLDHGAWVPLKIMYPEADIPVLQMSLPTQDPYKLLTLGSRLRELRDEGVLIIGSGFLTHGLPFLTEFRIDAAAPGWSIDFDAVGGRRPRPRRRGRAGVVPRQAPGMPYAHPTVEHYTPLFVTLGAATDPESPGRAAHRRLLDGPVEALACWWPERWAPDSQLRS